MKESTLSLWFQSALLFNINSNTKFVCANYSNGKLEILVGLDKTPTEDERDMFFSVSAEVTGNSAEFDDSKSKVIFLIDNTSIDDLAKDNMVFYARCDYLDENGNLVKEIS